MPLAAWVHRKLGLPDIHALIDGQRRDTDAHAAAIAHHGALINSLIEVLSGTQHQVQRTTQGAQDLHDRLSLYERGVPSIAKLRKARDERLAREIKALHAAAELAKEPETVPGTDEGPESAAEMAVVADEDAA